MTHYVIVLWLTFKVKRNINLIQQPVEDFKKLLSSLKTCELIYKVTVNKFFTVLPTSQVGYYPDKLIESVIYCFTIQELET